MDWKPKKWIAALLGLFLSPLGFLYVLRPWHALGYFFLYLGIVLLDFVRPEFIYHFVPSWFDFVFLFIFVSAFHCYELAGLSEPNAIRRWYSRWWGISSIVVTYILVALCLRTFVIEPFRNPSASMFPTLRPGQYFVAKKFGYGFYELYGVMLLHRPLSAAIARGDVMVFQSPKDPAISYVKRVVALPGDRFSFHNRRIIINDSPIPTRCTEIAGGQRCTEQWNKVRAHVVYDFSRYDTDFEMTIPQGAYFVMGDNRNNSMDSRFIGTIPTQNIVGKMWFK